MKANHERIVNILSANEDSFSKEVLALVMECMDENESLRQQKDSLAAYIKEREAETKSPIKVILVGNKDRKRIECKHCTSILEFDKIKDECSLADADVDIARQWVPILFDGSHRDIGKPTLCNF